jgi:hypothetical protein
VHKGTEKFVLGFQIQSKKELHVSHTEIKGIKTKKEIVLILFSWHFL